jgi:ATP phosphoribosyltransferase
MITIACAKGYLWEQALKYLNELGISFENNLARSRQLSTLDTAGKIKLMKVRPWDVPVYLEEGAADIGIVGKDVILEQQSDVLELLDLAFGGCRLVIAGPEHLRDSYLMHNIRVATKYEHSTLQYFQKKSIRCIPIKLYGAMELAPQTGVADIICDLSATGQTLTENQLVEYDSVFESTARLVSNRVSFMTKYDEIYHLYRGLTSVISGVK